VLACGKVLCRAPQISPAGDRLAYERTGPQAGGQAGYPQVWVLPLEAAGEPGEPVLAGRPDHETVQPAWSADGRLVFYDRTDKAFVFLDPSAQSASQFPNETGEPGSWDPDGRAYVAPEINFIEPGNPQQLPDLSRISNSHLIRFWWEDGRTEDLTQAENLEDAAPAYSPDGAFLAFARKYLDLSRWTPGRQLWVMPANGGEAQQLTNDPYFNHFDFTWSPAGDQLAYARFNQTTLNDPAEIWVLDLASTRASRLVIGGYAPAWIP
jgi:Tol biopolymer transport system component